MEFCPMGVIYIMLVVSLVIALLFLGMYVWATRNGQFDDDYTPSVRILFEEEQEQKQSDNHGNTEV
jgi:cbb3-type cytochrome oxidase maturation protein